MLPNTVMQKKQCAACVMRRHLQCAVCKRRSCTREGRPM